MKLILCTSTEMSRAKRGKGEGYVSQVNVCHKIIAWGKYQQCGICLHG